LTSSYRQALDFDNTPAAAAAPETPAAAWMTPAVFVVTALAFAAAADDILLADRMT